MIQQAVSVDSAGLNPLEAVEIRGRVHGWSSVLYTCTLEMAKGLYTKTNHKTYIAAG